MLTVLPADLAAIPDFQSGAMENWGLTTYRETGLLYDPEKSSASDKLSLTKVIAHELAHQVAGLRPFKKNIKTSLFVFPFLSYGVMIDICRCCLIRNFSACSWYRSTTLRVFRAVKED